MKRFLLAIALYCGLAGQAHAQLPVTDALSIAARALQAAQQLSQMIQQYQMMTSQYRTMVSTYNTLAHPTGVMGIAQGLGQLGRLPGSAAGIMPNASFGGSLTNGAQRFFDQNHVYTPQGSDFTATELARRQMATANMQAEAQAGMDRAEARISALSELQQSIQEQSDITSVNAVNARINSEQLFMANEANNVARLQLLQQTQSRVDMQRQEQSDRQSFEDYAAAQAAKAGF